MLGAVSPDGDVTVTVRSGVGLRTSSLCEDGGGSPDGAQSRGSGLRVTSHCGGTIGDASSGVAGTSRGSAAFGNCGGHSTGDAVGIGDGGTDRLADAFENGNRRDDCGDLCI